MAGDDRERGPCPITRRAHNITDRDGVISCIACHRTYERNPFGPFLVATWDAEGWSA